jgi:hypothetical protein
MPDPQLWIMDHGQTQVAAHLGNTEFLGIQEEAVVDKASGLEKLPTKDEE